MLTRNDQKMLHILAEASVEIAPADFAAVATNTSHDLWRIVDEVIALIGPEKFWARMESAR